MSDLVADPLPSPVVKRSIVLHGHKTSVSLEEPFWRRLRAMAAAERVPLTAFVSRIDDARQSGGLATAIRLAVLADLEARVVVGAKAPAEAA